MDKLILFLFIAFVCFIFYTLYRKFLVSARAKLIDSYVFPSSLTDKVLAKYPHLNQQQAEQVIQGLREYFHLCNIAGRKMVSMPSQVVDVAWHEFILFTRKYDYFCRKALGRFLHHTPAEAMSSPTIAQAGIKTAWRISCFREKMQPNAAHKLPILFALDSELQIPDGFKYSLNCNATGNDNYCAGHIGCGSGCSGCTSDSCGGGCGGD